MSKICVVNLITEGESRVVKREAYTLTDWKMTYKVIANFERKYGIWKWRDHFLRRIYGRVDRRFSLSYAAYDREKRLSTRPGSHRRGTVSAGSAINDSSWVMISYRRRTTDYTHYDCYGRITQPSSSGGVREAPVAWPAFCRLAVLIQNRRVTDR